MNEKRAPNKWHDKPSKPRIIDPGQLLDKRAKYGCADLQKGDTHGKPKQAEQCEPVADGAAREAQDVVPLRFSREFIPVPGYNEEIFDILAYGPPVIPPERRDSIQDERQSVHSKFPDLLVLNLVAFLQRDDLRELEDA